MSRIFGLITLFGGLTFLYFLQSASTIGDKPLPPLGNFLNPYSGIWQNAEPEDSYTDLELASDSISDDVRIVFDERMVPHIYAQNLKDALFAQGYVEAYHRLFQMDLSTRSPDGRLSEILGENLLAYDQKQRRLGLSYAADNAVKSWEKFPELLTNIDAYAAGINYYINQLEPADYPMEYKLLDFAPQQWTNRHCALLLKAMSQTLAGYEEDVEMSNALKLFGEKDFKTIYPYYNPKDVPVIEGPYTPVDYTQVSAVANAELSAYLPRLDRPRSPDGVGSNNWAINGSKSETGRPILANDPHLPLSLPSTWYEIAITTPDFSAHGVTLLGMPGIMIGFNEHIAWGETNVGHDVMDYYSVQWTDSTKTYYMLDGKKTAADLKIETYKVKGVGEVHDTVRYTHWGPVVEDETNLALRWLVHDGAATPEFMSFVDGMGCTTYAEYLDATGSFQSPAQNFIYADNSGDIGLRINGKLPIKRKGQGVTVTDGSSKANGWQGFIPRNENPQEYNPARGYVSSSNQWSTSPNYPYFYNGRFEGYRGRMAHRFLSQDDTFGVAEMKALQLNNYSIEAEEALAVMLPLLDSVNRKRARTLTEWNFEYNAASKAAPLFDEWYTSFERLLWDEVYGRKDVDLPVPHTWVTINLIGKYPQHKYYDIQSTSVKETLKDIVNLSFVQVINNPQMTLGKAKKAYIPHLTRLPALSSDTLNIGGTKRALNAMRQTVGPSWRMVVALGDEPEAYGVYPGGQSGNPASAYYSNQIETWAKGSYNKIPLATQPEKISNPIFNITISNEK
ncbi:MAG: penicillin acylase family protein [Bacteroidetes bacterium]|nr:penicillin acylase family protein [Bacteroidota bacterium]